MVACMAGCMGKQLSRRFPPQKRDLNQIFALIRPNEDTTVSRVMVDKLYRAGTADGIGWFLIKMHMKNNVFSVFALRATRGGSGWTLPLNYTRVLLKYQLVCIMCAVYLVTSWSRMQLAVLCLESELLCFGWFAV